MDSKNSIMTQNVRKNVWTATSRAANLSGHGPIAGPSPVRYRRDSILGAD